MSPMSIGIVERKIQRVAKRTTLAMELELRSYSGYWLCTKDATLIGGVTKREVWNWLDAFEKGFEHAEKSFMKKI